MKQITFTVYTYDELTPPAQDKARDWFRETDEPDFDWVIDDAENIANQMGLEFRTRAIKLHSGKTATERCVFWSGFSSQGDGACFEGTWHASSVKPGGVKDYAPVDTALHEIADTFERIAKQFPHASFTVKHHGRYSHEHCTDFDVSIVDGEENEIDSPAAEAAAEELIEAARDFMRWIYRSLESAWEEEITSPRPSALMNTPSANPESVT